MTAVNLTVSPANSAPVDVAAGLASVLTGLGLTTADGGGDVTFTGTDPVVPSRVRLATAGAVAMAARNVAVAAIWRDRTGVGQDVHVDLRRVIHSVSPFFHRPYVTLNGYPLSPDDPGNEFDMTFYRTRDDRWVMALNSYPGIRDRMAAVLNCRNHRRSVTEAIGRWYAAELEQAAQSYGAVCSIVRTPDEWRREPQRQFVGGPLVEVTRIGESDPEPLGGADRPLAGLRALGMAHVLAGPALGGALAEQGADVLNLWHPTRYEPQRTYCWANAGLRSTTLDVSTPDGRTAADRLLAGADVFFTNYRPARVDAWGFGAEECARRRPGLIHVSFSCFGHDGPWSTWAGYDPQALCVTGVATVEGGGAEPRLPATVVFNDYVSGWLAAAGVMAALRRRAVEGGSWRVRINLVRCSEWLLSFGLADPAAAPTALGEPHLADADTPLGRFVFMPSQVDLSRTPPRFDVPLVPRGSCPPVWLDRTGAGR